MNKFSITILSVISIVGLLAIGALFGGYLPNPQIEKLEEETQKLGASITVINATDLIKDSRAVINTNFSNLNTGKLEASDLTGFGGFGNLTAQTLTATSTTATSTISWGLAAIQRLGIGSTATTTILGNSATSTFSCCITTGGLLSSNGITLTGGNLLSSGLLTITNTGTSTFSGGISVAGGGLVTSQGLTITGGNFLSSGLLTVTNSATSTFTGGLTAGGFTAPYLTSASSLSLLTTGSNVLTFSTNNTERMRIDATGNVGIGTTTPGLLFSTAGNGLFSGSTGTTTIEHGANLATLGGAVRIATTSAVSSYKLLIDGSATIVQKRIASAASPTFNWSESNSQIMTLNQAGHSISFSGGQPGATLRLELCQDSTANRTVTSWGSNILFLTSDLINSTSTPGLATKSGACNLFSFTVSMATGTQVYFGTLPLKTK